MGDEVGTGISGDQKPGSGARQDKCSIKPPSAAGAPSAALAENPTLRCYYSAMEWCRG